VVVAVVVVVVVVLIVIVLQPKIRAASACSVSVSGALRRAFHVSTAAAASHPVAAAAYPIASSVLLPQSHSVAIVSAALSGRPAARAVLVAIVFVFIVPFRSVLEVHHTDLRSGCKAMIEDS